MNAFFFLFAGVLLGIVAATYQLTPRRIAGAIYRRIKKPEKTYGPWAIGIFEGSTPFELKEPMQIKNPILTGKEITDFDASFVADPFLLFVNGKWFLFFEALDRQTQKGVICYASSENGQKWKYEKTVLKEPFHLSYPYMFKAGDDYFMIPESNEDFSVRLYKATQFPDKWELECKLLSGYDYIDPSVFYAYGKWWMFVSTAKSNVLNLYFSDDIHGEWKAHPLNPIVRDDPHTARPAGRVFEYNGSFYRLAQDTFPVYGSRVFAFRILELTEYSYKEEAVSAHPIVEKSAKGWNAEGMHHLDCQKVGEKWIAATDGRWTK